ncbi:hypothetical protein G7046_g4149 [Stylonectria norvegica]|nr:hypothetical protein G7046_g4149 [Stylonectria norvegica]
MEPPSTSLVTRSAALAATISTTTDSLPLFIREVHESQSKMVGIISDLRSIERTLQLLVEDVESATYVLPPLLETRISAVLSNCSGVCDGIGACLNRHKGSREEKRAMWATRGQSDIAVLATALKSHQETLNLTFDMLTICDLTAVSEVVAKPTWPVQSPRNLTLQRYLNEMTSTPRVARQQARFTTNTVSELSTADHPLMEVRSAYAVSSIIREDISTPWGGYLPSMNVYAKAVGDDNRLVTETESTTNAEPLKRRPNNAGHSSGEPAPAPVSSGTTNSRAASRSGNIDFDLSRSAQPIEYEDLNFPTPDLSRRPLEQRPTIRDVLSVNVPRSVPPPEHTRDAVFGVPLASIPRSALIRMQITVFGKVMVYHIPNVVHQCCIYLEMDGRCSSLLGADHTGPPMLRRMYEQEPEDGETWFHVRNRFPKELPCEQYASTLIEFLKALPAGLVSGEEYLTLCNAMLLPGIRQVGKFRRMFTDDQLYSKKCRYRVQFLALPRRNQGILVLLLLFLRRLYVELYQMSGYRKHLKKDLDRARNTEFQACLDIFRHAICRDIPPGSVQLDTLTSLSPFPIGPRFV